MIARATGEILFLDGLIFTPHALLVAKHLEGARAHAMLALPGWTQHFLGVHESDRGSFDVEAVSDPACRIQTVFLAHAHVFYESATARDSERRAFHEGVIASDLGGQHEFSWGQVFCRLNEQTNTDWLVVAYTAGPQVPLHPPEIYFHLQAHAIFSS